MILVMLILPFCASAQEVIHGKVTTFGVIPLNNAKLVASKSGGIAYSDPFGYFSINCNEKDVIRIMASGFDRQRIKVKDPDSLFIDLVYSNDETSFVEATKNGHLTREALQQAIREYPLKGEKDYSDYSNIYELIDVEILTVQVNGTSITSLKPRTLTGSQDVLLVINGQVFMDISFVSPNDVKSVRYLEGSAASRWGARGANGVIEINTK